MYYNGSASMYHIHVTGLFDMNSHQADGDVQNVGQIFLCSSCDMRRTELLFVLCAKKHVQVLLLAKMV